MATTQRTTNHEVIRAWTEARGGTPARVSETNVLRMHFPGLDEASLEDITWDDFFAEFDAQSCEFLYDDTPESKFNTLVYPNEDTGAAAVKDGGEKEK